MAIELVIGLDAISSYKRLSYTPWHALAEFVDNSTQAYLNERPELDRRFKALGEQLEVSITYNHEDDVLRIADNSSGMSHDELSRALQIARRPAITTGRSKYGMGMKTAACWLGDFWTLRTKRLDCPEEFTVEVDVKRIMGGDADLREKVKRIENTARHYTIIEIRQLHHSFKGRTLGKIKDYLRSMYRQDFRDGILRLLWNGEVLTWEEVDSRLLRAPDGSVYRKEFEFEVKDRRVHGWVGVLAIGSRASAGFSILHSKRVVKGWPDAWRPASLYGQIGGSNDLINQRLVGEIHLDGFDVSHTKDDILWGSAEEEIEQKLEEVCHDYREVARKFRKGSDERKPSAIETKTALEELERELTSSQLVDAIHLEIAPDPDAITKAFRGIVENQQRGIPTFRVKLDAVVLKVYVTPDRSENDPYFVCDATRFDEVCVVVNESHPHWRQLSGAEGVLNYLRHCVYDALAEHMARHKKATIEPDTIKLFKDNFLRLAFEIEEASSRTEDEARNVPGS